MKETDLKRLKRNELLEVMLAQQERIEALEKELEIARKRLKERELKISQAGNLAEASLAVTKIFEEAQKAADIYLQNIKKKQ